MLEDYIVVPYFIAGISMNKNNLNFLSQMKSHIHSPTDDDNLLEGHLTFH